MTRRSLIALLALRFVLACDSDHREAGSDDDPEDEPAQTFDCEDGRHTISRDQVCDGVVECNYGHDEEDCPGSEYTVCNSDDEFRQRLYTPEQHCNGRAECFFAEDEEGCAESLLCPNYAIGGGYDAIPRAKVCDGVWDCTIDERDCPEVENPFACPEGYAIDRKFVCDQVIDCVTSMADEADASCHQFMCEPRSDEVGLRSCSGCASLFVADSKVCDGVRDCGSGRDESDCQ